MKLNIKEVSKLKKEIKKKQAKLDSANSAIQKNIAIKKITERDIDLLNNKLLSVIPDYKESKKPKRK